MTSAVRVRTGAANLGRRFHSDSAVSVFEAATPPGQSATFTLHAKVVTETVLTAAAVGADTPDPKLANNVAAAVTVVK
jgi:hypothetical protein